MSEESVESTSTVGDTQEASSLNELTICVSVLPLFTPYFHLPLLLSAVKHSAD